MAVAANSLRLSLRACSHAPTARIAPKAARQAFLARRALSSTSSRRADETDETTKDASPATPIAGGRRSFQDLLTILSNQRKLKEEEIAELTAIAKDPFKDVPEELKKNLFDNRNEMSKAIEQLRRPLKPKRGAFWNEGETDSDLITDEIGEDDFEEDDMMSMAHPKLEEHRELREYARIAVWEMPLLSELAKPFEPPTEKQVLRFRYTTYMGEFHPADRKVVVEFAPKDLTDLTEAQQLKLMKLAGARYNPSKEIVKMSCERFEHQAQNKRYLADLVNKMIEMAKDPTDTFEDVPLDTRHHKVKVTHKFPKEWALTAERKAELAAIREQAYLLDKMKKESGALVDGVEIVQQLEAPEAEPEPVMARRGTGKLQPRGRQPMRR